MATVEDILRELPAAARPPARQAWEALPEQARERLERSLEARFGLQQAIVAPLSHPDADPVPAISARTTTGAEIIRRRTGGGRFGIGSGS